MDDTETRSSGSAPPAAVVLEGTNLERTLPALGARKTEDGEERVGRRVGREEKVLAGG